MLTESEYAERERPPSSAHPLCKRLRELRHASGLSLAEAGYRFGKSPIVIGAYERGDRIPPLTKLDALFRDYGYRLEPVKIDDTAVIPPADMAHTLRIIADQLARGSNASDQAEAGI